MILPAKDGSLGCDPQAKYNRHDNNILCNNFVNTKGTNSECPRDTIYKSSFSLR